MRKKRRKKSYEIWQKHHLEYAIPDMFGNIVMEKVVKITRTEHFFCGRLESYAKAHSFSPGMCTALRYLVKKYKRRKDGGNADKKN